jgi:hypothetical protein
VDNPRLRLKLGRRLIGGPPRRQRERGPRHDGASRFKNRYNRRVQTAAVWIRLPLRRNHGCRNREQTRRLQLLSKAAGGVAAHKLYPKPKLTLHQHREAIRRRDKLGETLADIARSYHVGSSTISRLRETRAVE